ncbi:MAG: hypothetical protein ACLSEY_14775 [Enterocloster sp.]
MALRGVENSFITCTRGGRILLERYSVGRHDKIQNRTERWDAPEDSAYPKLHTEHNVINAAFSLATDIMCQNRNKKYALPGQEGLMNAAVFQREGEGLARDTCHRHFDVRIYLHRMKPGSLLLYISEHGFNTQCVDQPPCWRLQHGINI